VRAVVPLWLLVALKWLHIATASVWFGGLVFTVIVNRALAQLLGPEEALRATSFIGRRMQRPLRYSLYVAIATGIFNAAARYGGFAFVLEPGFYASSTGELISIKAGLVILLLLTIYLHSRLGAKLAALGDAPASPLRRSLRAAGWLALLLTLAIMLLGSALRFS
jgi:uncharacterized membrane protein